MTETERLVGLTSVFVLGIGAQWIAWRIHFPSIVLLLGFGFIAGPITHYLEPDALIGRQLLFPMVSLSVALILFEGGLTLKLSDLDDIGIALWGLLTVGVVVTWILATLAAFFLLQFSLPMSLLLGAILVVTGPTVVGPLLSHVRPVGRVAAIARWEGIVVDPIGAVLAVLVLQSIEAIHGANLGQAILNLTLGLLGTAVTGVTVTAIASLPLLAMLRRHLIPDFLQSPMLLMAVVGAFTVSNLVQHESGLLTVTLMGVLFANQKAVDIKHIVEFKENLRVLLISSLFILLAARLDPSHLNLLDWRIWSFVALIILVIRPASVFAGTMRSDLNIREKLFLSWIAPRGIVAASVASVFAHSLGPEGDSLVAATFMVIIGTVVVYGISLSRVALYLGLAKPDPQGLLIASAHPAARAIAVALKDWGIRVLMIDTNRFNTKTARLEGLSARTADILSDHEMRELDLGGIGRFLGFTRNDEVNSLGALRFIEFFGRSQVYQLASDTSRTTSDEVSHLRGRVLFAKHATYSYLDRRFAEGAVIKRTKLTEEFDLKAFKELYGETALPLFIVSESGILTVCSPETPPAKKGQTLIALVNPVTESTPAAPA